MADARFLAWPVALPQQPTPQQDTLLPDSLGQAFEELGESVTETGRLILDGDWGALVARLTGYATGLAESFLPRLISALFVGLVFYLLFRGVRSVSQRVLHRSRRVNAGLEALLLRTLNVIGLAFILILVLSQMGVNVAALVAGLGIAGIAIGFAAKDTLENFIAGVTILLDAPFAIGDWVEVEDTYGQVIELTLRSTRIRTLENRVLVVPNLLMINQSLENRSELGRPRGLRVDIPFGIAYKEYPDEARKVVLGLTEGDDRLRDDAAHDTVVTGLGDSSVDMALRLWVKDPGQEVPVRLEYLERVRAALREADIEIPFPHLQLFIDEAEAFREATFMARGGAGPRDGTA